MTDRTHLLLLQRAANAQHDGGRRLGDFAREQRAFRQHEVNAGRLNPVDGPDGPCQLTFESAQVIDILNETCRTEGVGLVEDLVADATALGQAAFGQLHAQPRDLVLGHHDDGAVVAQFKGNRLTLELLDDAR